MIKHVILWKVKEEFDGEKKAEIKANVKQHLEALKGVVPGLLEIQVQIDGLDSSNADLMLDSTLESEDALKGYQVHETHVHVANTYVRPYMELRLCMDYVQ